MGILLLSDRISRQNLSFSRSISAIAPQNAYLLLSNVRRSKSIMEAGQFHKAIQSLTSEGVALVSEKIYQDMMRKHYHAPTPFMPRGECHNLWRFLRPVFIMP